MNRRTVVLISICFLLAVAAVTMRSIEQEMESIKAQFVGENQSDERSNRSGSSSRPNVPKTLHSETMPLPATQDAGMPPVAKPVTAAPADSTIPAGVSLRSGPAISGVKAAPPTTSIVQQRKKAEAVNEMPRRPAVEELEDVKTPLEPDATNELQDGSTEPDITGEAEIQDAPQPGAEELIMPAPETVGDDDSVLPMDAEEQLEEPAEEGDIEGQDAADEDYETADDYEYPEEERIDEGELYYPEEAVGDEEIVTEDDMFYEEGEMGEETEEAWGGAEQAEEVFDEE